MLSVLRHRNYFLLWLGGLVSTLGDYALMIALPFYVYQQTGSTWATGGVILSRTIANTIFGSLAGVFVDRWNLKHTMIAADLLRALFIFLFFLLANSIEWLWIIYPVAFIESAISRFFHPAKSALIPRIVGEQLLVNANSLDKITNKVISLIGPVIGGSVFAWFALVGVICFDGISYFASAIILSGVVLPGTNSKQENDVEDVKLRSFLKDWISGIQQVKENQILKTTFVVSSLAMLGQGIYSVIIVPFVQDIHRGSSIEFGWIITAQSLGGLIGGFITARMARSWGLTRLMANGIILVGIIFIISVYAQNLWIVFILFAALGIPSVIYVVCLDTIIQKNAGEDHIGRVFGTLSTLESTTLLFGVLIGSSLGTMENIRLLLAIAGICYCLSGVYVYTNKLIHKGTQATSEKDYAASLIDTQ